MSDIRPIVFGKYCLLERLSLGGMAEVYRARPFEGGDPKRFLALKRILPNLAADDEFIEMFIDEAKVSVQLNHRNICQIYELGRQDGSFFIVMEFIAGRDILALQNWFRKRRRIMPSAYAAWITAEVCDALDYAHRKVDDNGRPLHIVHRDVSPQNVIVAFDGSVKLIDFGIARAATTNQNTQDGVLKGKFGYMSPEQADGLDIDHQSDIFALGTLLWEMVTARRLFHGESDFATLEQVRSAEIVPPSQKNPEVPEALDRIIFKALTRDRAGRYQWASDFAADLRAFLKEHAPNFDTNSMREWMSADFAPEIRMEAAKTNAFERFMTVTDVHAWYAAHPDVEVARLSETVTGSADDTSYAPEGSSIQESAEGSADNVGLGIRLEEGDISFGDDHMAPLANRSRLDVASLPPPRRSRAGLYVGLVVLLLALGGVGYWLTQSGGSILAPSTGALTVEAPGVDNVRVIVNGVPLQGPPFAMDDLEPGTQIVEVSAEGYLADVQSVQVTAGQTVTAHFEMVSIRSLRGTLSLELSDGQAQVWINGQLQAGAGQIREIELSAGEAHTVEVYAPGYFVEQIEVELDPHQPLNQRVELRPVMASIALSSQPAGDVFLNDELLGNTEQQLNLEVLDVKAPIEVEIRPQSPSFRPWRQTIVFDSSYDIRLAPSLPRIGQGSAEVAPELGQLAVREGDDWFRIFLDDRDTGLITPIPEDEPFTLRAGDHILTFVRAHEQRTLPIVVGAGELVVVDLPPPN